MELNFRYGAEGFKKILDQLPEVERNRVFALVYDALLWRGHDKEPVPFEGHSIKNIRIIAAIFSENGMGIEELT